MTVLLYADILEIIDHHRIGTLETLEPVYFRNQPVGCTATIIYQMYQENRVQIPKEYCRSSDGSDHFRYVDVPFPDLYIY